MIIRKIKSIWNYFKVFRSVTDIQKFRSLFKANHVTGKPPVSIKVKETKSKDVYCRPGSSDHKVLWDTFFEKFHLPPFPLKENEVILDLGANVGYTMLHFAYCYPKARVYGVEMDRNNFLLAQKNIEPLQEQCRIIQAAVWSDNGQISYDNSGEEWGFRIDPANNKPNEGSKVPAKTVDAIMLEFGIDQIHYLKMDIEGAEEKVLEAPGAWIGKVKMMKVEVHEPFTVQKCIATLQAWGFHTEKDKKHAHSVIGVRN